MSITGKDWEMCGCGWILLSGAVLVGGQPGDEGKVIAEMER